MKDKPFMRTSMEEISMQFKDKNKKNIFVPKPTIVTPEGEAYKANFQQETDRAFAERDRKINAYNAKLASSPDTLYSQIDPLRYLIIRLFHKVPKRPDKSGLYLPIESYVNVPTQNGMGVLERIQTPYAFERVGRVIAVSEANKALYPIGTWVQVHWHICIPRKNSKESPIEFSHSFTHYAYPDKAPPTDPEDTHFGYFRIDPFSDIAAILPEGAARPAFELPEGDHKSEA